MSIKVDTDADLDDMTVHISVEYFSGNNAEMISDDSFYFSDTLDGLISGDFTMNIPDDAQCCIFRCDIENISDTGSVTLSLDKFYLDLDVSALYLQQLQTGKTNAILERVEQQLADQGQTLDDVLSEQQQTNDKLDDIITYEPDLSTPEGGEIIDDLEELEGGLLSDSEDGLNSALEIQQSTLDILVEYFSAFGALAIIFNLFSTLPFFQALLYASLSLGVFSLVFGLSLSVVKSVSERSGGSKSHKGG